MVQMEKKKANRLVKEKSPYLLQHAYNPVDWFPWGDEALEKAAREEKPIFLSIGYSTCHWCHVMEKDSFEDPEVAAIINEYFVPIKVDREERPDLDQKYMAACQALTGQGGWPLTVFLTPEGKPFYAGTFFPKNACYGINGLMEILPRLSTYWKDDRERVINAADELVEALKEVGRALHRESSDNNLELPGTDLLEKAYLSLKQSFDQENGGFGGAPKFPTPHQLTFLLRHAAKTGSAEAGRMAIETLRAIHRGGIFDQLGYGLHRYSVDSRWHIPHFEKMLYDQAMAALAAVEAYRYSGDEEMSCFARKTFSYLLENLTSPDGAFYSAEDADSEGEEGKFYVWKAEEVLALLGPEKGRLFNAYYGVTDEGNFEKGNNVFYRGIENASFAASEGISAGELDQILEEARLKLLERRSGRIRPFLDDKIITSWNALQIAALAVGGRAFEERSFLEAAERAARFIIDKMLDSDGILYRRYRDGERAIPGFLDDYAYMVWALLELYRATVKPDYLELAKKLNSRMLELFYIREGMLSYSAHDQGDDQNMLEAEAYDGAMPSGLSVAAMNLLQLGRICLDENLREKGKELIIAQRRQIEKYPAGYTYLLAALQEAILPNAGPAYCTADGNCGLE